MAIDKDTRILRCHIPARNRMKIYHLLDNALIEGDRLNSNGALFDESICFGSGKRWLTNLGKYRLRYEIAKGAIARVWVFNNNGDIILEEGMVIARDVHGKALAWGRQHENYILSDRLERLSDKIYSLEGITVGDDNRINLSAEMVYDLTRWGDFSRRQAQVWFVREGKNSRPKQIQILADKHQLSVSLPAQEAYLPSLNINPAVFVSKIRADNGERWVLLDAIDNSAHSSKIVEDEEIRKNIRKAITVIVDSYPKAKQKIARVIIGELMSGNFIDKSHIEAEAIVKDLFESPGLRRMLTLATNRDGIFDSVQIGKGGASSAFFILPAGKALAQSRVIILSLKSPPRHLKSFLPRPRSVQGAGSQGAGEPLAGSPLEKNEPVPFLTLKEAIESDFNKTIDPNLKGVRVNKISRLVSGAGKEEIDTHLLVVERDNPLKELLWGAVNIATRLTAHGQKYLIDNGNEINEDRYRGTMVWWLRRLLNNRDFSIVVKASEGSKKGHFIIRPTLVHGEHLGFGEKTSVDLAVNILEMAQGITDRKKGGQLLRFSLLRQEKGRKPCPICLMIICSR